MGIRYYAWPVPAAGVEAARLYPWAFMDKDPFSQAWFTSNEGNCYLDKAWQDLQWLLGPESPSDGTARAAAALVAGQVTFTPEGWIPHIRVLDPEQVRDASADLDSAMPSLLTKLSGAEVVDGAGDSGTGDYVRHHLRALQRFAAEQAAAGRGLVYMIG